MAGKLHGHSGSSCCSSPLWGRPVPNSNTGCSALPCPPQSPRVTPHPPAQHCRCHHCRQSCLHRCCCPRQRPPWRAAPPSSGTSTTPPPAGRAQESQTGSSQPASDASFLDSSSTGCSSHILLQAETQSEQEHALQCISYVSRALPRTVKTTCPAAGNGRWETAGGTASYCSCSGSGLTLPPAHLQQSLALQAS